MNEDTAHAGPSGEATATESQPPRRRRWPRVALLLLVLLVLLLVGLRISLPTVVERGAAYASRYWLGLPVRIDNADFNLLEGVVVLEGVAVGAAPDDVEPMDAALEPPVLDAATALLHLERIFVHLSWQDLRDGGLRLPQFVLEGPSIRLVRESDGAIDPLRHARPLAPVSEEEETDEEEAEPWPVAVERFALTSPNVVIIDPAGGEELLAFSLEKFELDHITADGGNFALGGIGIEGPVLRVRRDLVLGSPEAAAAAPPPAAVAPATSPASAPAPAPAPPSRTGYRIEKIDIARATFTWVTDQGPLDVALALKATDITADEGERFPIDLQLEIGGGSIALAGQVGILPPAYTGRLQWKGLPFPPLLLASLPDLAEWLRSADSTGDLSVDLDISGARGAPAIYMSGQAAIDTLEVADPAGKEVAVGWKQLEVKMKEVLVPLPEEGKAARTTVANLESLRLVEPKIHYTHPSPSLDDLLGRPATAATPSPADAGAAGGEQKPPAGKPAPAAGAEAAPAAETAPASAAADAAEGRTGDPGAQHAASPVDLTISLLELVAGDMEVVDTTVTPPVTSFLHELEFSARDVHVPDPSASQIRLRAILPKASILEVQGDLKPGNIGDFTVSLQKLDLPVFSPYASSAAGASLDAGQVSVKTRLKLRGARMEVDNDLVLRKFGVSLRDPGEFDRNFGMPIDLALALLRDPAGDIRLKIPVRIDEKGAAQVSMGAVIASALKAALLGAVTAPLKMLGAAFGGPDGEAGGEGGGGLSIAPIACVAGGFDLAPEATARLDALAKLLSERPSMGLGLRGRTGPQDRPLVAEQILIERLNAGDGLPDLEDSGFLARRRVSQALLARDKQAGKKAEIPVLSAEDQALYERYLAVVEIPAARLDALARARAERVREALQAKGVAPGRLEVGDRESDGDPGVILSFRALP